MPYTPIRIDKEQRYVGDEQQSVWDYEFWQSEVEPFEGRDWHSINTIKFGEVVSQGFDWGRTLFGKSYINKRWYKKILAKDLEKPQEERIFDGHTWQYIEKTIREDFIDRFENYYWNREVSLLPLLVWQKILVRNIDRLWTQYLIFLSFQFNLDPDYIGGGRSRTVNSEYPQSQIQGSNDYASDAQDKQWDTYGNLWQLYLQLLQNYKDPMAWLLDNLENNFSQLFSINVNIL